MAKDDVALMRAAARRARRRCSGATACASSATTGPAPRTSPRRPCCAPGGTAPCSTSPPPAVRAWLFTVARNIVIDEWRSRRCPQRDPGRRGARDRTADDDSDQLLLSWVVAEALTQLSDDHRAVLLECYYRGRPVAEAARRLGVPEGTVKSRTHYALRALRLALEEMGVSA